MSELKPLKFNIEYLDIYQSGGFEPKNDWWIIAIVIVVIIIIISIVISRSSSNSNSTSVSVSKRSVNGEDVYYKEVDGEEQELTDEEKEKYDKLFDKNVVENDDVDLTTEDIMINDPSYLD